MQSATAYEMLIEAASTLSDAEILSDIDAVDTAQAAAFVAERRPAFGAARQALRAKPSALLKYHVSYVRACADTFEHLRNLAMAFALEVRVARADGDLSRAVDIGVDIFELANAARRGHLVSGALVSVGLGQIATDELRRLRTELDDVQRRTLTGELDRLDREREPWADIVARDRQWEIAVDYHAEPFDYTQLPYDPEIGLSEETHSIMCEWLQAMASLPEDDLQGLMKDGDNNGVACMRMLAIDLALRSHRESYGSYPKDLLPLAPGVLARLPVDPFTDEPFVYRPLYDDSFLLYSPGPRKNDHGGVFGHWMTVCAGQADLCLDAYDYEIGC